MEVTEINWKQVNERYADVLEAELALTSARAALLRAICGNAVEGETVVTDGRQPNRHRRLVEAVASALRDLSNGSADVDVDTDSILDYVGDALDLSQEERERLTPKGDRNALHNSVMDALTRMKYSGLAELGSVMGTRRATKRLLEQPWSESWKRYQARRNG